MDKRIPANIQAILSEMKSELKKGFPQRLKKIVLFGSYARGDHSEGSDIDIVILLRESDDLMAEREIYLPIVTRLSLKYDVVISIIPIRDEEYRTRSTPLYLNVRREGIAV